MLVNIINMNHQQKRDLAFGLNNENIVLSRLRNYFSPHIKRSVDSYALFDYVDEHNKVKYELKSRRTHKNDYYDVMVGYNKVYEGLNNPKHKDYRIIFVWSFIDRLCYHEVTKHNHNPSWIRSGGRTDRNKNEIDRCYYVPTKCMKDID